jgi:DNA adenine methylase
MIQANCPASPEQVAGMHYDRVPSPLRYHGGKSYLADRIVALLPPHTHFVETHFGGGSVLFAKSPEGVSEVANDIYLELSVFWRVLQDPHGFELFKRRLEATPFSQVEWEDAEDFSTPSIEGPVERAARFFIRNRQSLAGRMDHFSPLSRNRTRRGMNEQASAWLSAIEGLPAVHARLQRVAITNLDAVKLIQREDSPGTLFYVDPPYVPESRVSTDVYANEMSYGQHCDLLSALSQIKGKFALSGYHSELYDICALHWGWHCTEFVLPNNAAGGAVKRRMFECVWTNYDPAVKS